jgi:hypothetical protein
MNFAGPSIDVVCWAALQEPLSKTAKLIPWISVQL